VYLAKGDSHENGKNIKQKIKCGKQGGYNDKIKMI